MRHGFVAVPAIGVRAVLAGSAHVHRDHRVCIFAEDQSQICPGVGLAVIAAVRDLPVNLHRLAGATNIAAACRTLPHRIRGAGKASADRSLSGDGDSLGR